MCVVPDQSLVCSELLSEPYDVMCNLWMWPLPISHCSYGVLHAWKSNLRNKRFTFSSDARAILAQSCGYPSSRVPQWLLEPLHRHTRHTVASAPVTCLRHSSNGRPRTGIPASLRKSRSSHFSDVRRRTIWANSLGERARPHDSGSGPCMPRKSSASRARPTLLEHSSISSTVTVGNDGIADSVSLLKVGSRMVRTY